MTSGAVMLVMDLAAYFRAFNDAVKLDLNVNLRGGTEGSVLISCTSVFVGLLEDYRVELIRVYFWAREWVVIRYSPLEVMTRLAASVLVLTSSP